MGYSWRGSSGYLRAPHAPMLPHVSGSGSTKAPHRRAWAVRPPLSFLTTPPVRQSPRTKGIPRVPPRLGGDPDLPAI